MPITHPPVGSHLKVDILEKEKVLILTLNRPEKFNAISAPLTADMEKMLDWYEDEPGLWVLIITGVGKAFCGGQDLGAVQSNADAPEGEKKSFYTKNGFAGVSLRRFLKPVICAINGGAFGGGAEIAMNCDIIIAAEGAPFAFPEVLRGVHAAVGGIPNTFLRSPQLVPYLLTGERIPPPLLKAHVFTEVVPKDQLMPTALKWAAKLTKASPDSIQITKDQLNLIRLDGYGVTETNQRNLAGPVVAKNATGANFKEGIQAFMEKRDVSWKNPAPLPKAKI